MNIILFAILFYIIPIIPAIPFVKVYNKWKKGNPRNQFDPGIILISWFFWGIVILDWIEQHFIANKRVAKFFNYEGQ